MFTSPYAPTNSTLCPKDTLIKKLKRSAKLMTEQKNSVIGGVTPLFMIIGFIFQSFTKIEQTASYKLYSFQPVPSYFPIT